jgi:hypothetical protein
MNNTFYKLYFKDLKEQFEFDNERYFIDNEIYAEDIIYTKNILANDILFFIKMSDFVYYDLIGRNIFKKVDDNIFYNDRTGLYFDEKLLIKTNDSNEVLKRILNKEYSFYLKDYFKMHRLLNKIDNELIQKSESIMLIRGIKYNKKN